jgi:hypothetical protein
MARRPVKEWWERCTTKVAAKGGAYDPAGVCGAVWARKGSAERRKIARAAYASMPYEIRHGRDFVSQHRSFATARITARRLAGRHPGERFKVINRISGEMVGYAEV